MDICNGIPFKTDEKANLESLNQRQVPLAHLMSKRGIKSHDKENYRTAVF